MKLIKSTIVLLSLIFSFSAFADVPLLNSEPGAETYYLHKHYVVKTLWLDDLARLGIQNAIEMWNKAAGKTLISFDAPVTPEDTLIYITPLNGQDWAGIALCYDEHVCTINTGEEFRYNVNLYVHEIGHTLGFAHTYPKKPSEVTVMTQGSYLRPHITGIDKETTKTLRHLLRENGRAI